MAIVAGQNIRNAYADTADESLGRKIVQVYDNGETTGFVTGASTLREALQEADIHVDEKDLVEPSLDEKLVANSYDVNIYRARPVIIRDGTIETKVLTAYRTYQQIAKEAKIELYNEDKTELTTSTNVLADGAGEIMTIDRAVPFTFVFYGKTIEARTQAANVADMLKERGIEITANDKLSVESSTPITAGMEVRLWREGKQTITVDEEVDFKVEKINDANRNVGYREVKTPGVKGNRTAIYEITVQHGVETERKEISSTTTKEPVAQVEIIGVKGRYTTPSENESITWNFLIGRGYSRVQAAGIMGNLMQEHKFNTSGDGLAQWTGSRQQKLRQMFPGSYDTIYSQLEFLVWELEGGYSRVNNKILSSESLKDVTQVFQDEFERCNPKYCMLDQRLIYARNILASH